MTAHLPQTPHSLLTFVADYLHGLRFYGAASRVRCHETAPLTPPESWELCREITDRRVSPDATLLADYLVRLVSQSAWPEIEVGMRALQSTKSSRAACDAIMAYEAPKETTR